MHPEISVIGTMNTDLWMYFASPPPPPPPEKCILFRGGGGYEATVHVMYMYLQGILHLCFYSLVHL